MNTTCLPEFSDGSMHSGTGKHPHTLQREGPVGKRDPKNRIDKGGHQSDPCTWTVVEVMCNPLAHAFSSPAI